MCTKHYTHCSVESDGTRCISPFTVFSVWNRSTGCRNLNTARGCSGHRGRGYVLKRDVLKHATVKPPLFNI